MIKRSLLRVLAAIAAGLVLEVAMVPALADDRSKTTFVLVHGAFAGADGWADVTRDLLAKGHNVIAAANPLRSVASDSAALGAVIDSVSGPVVLVGHSYGGFLISNAAVGRPNVKGLVFVAAFVPDAGESVVDLAGRFPGSTLGETLAPVSLPDGGKDLYIAQTKYHHQFCADVPRQRASIMATNQRPITEAAILEKSAGAAWKTVPSWHIYGTADNNIPAAAMNWMAQRANAREVVELRGASHVPHVSHPAAVARIVLSAAAAQK